MQVSLRKHLHLLAYMLGLLLSTNGLAFGGIFGIQPLTGDADSGISATKIYTHAFDVNRTGSGDGGSLSINGVPFSVGGISGGTDANFGGAYTALGFSSAFNGHPTGVTGGIGDAIDDFFYNGNSITLSGLTPKQVYKTVFYTSDGYGGNPQTILFSDNLQQETGVVRNAGRIEYTYSAPSTGEITYAFTPESSGTFHNYAFTNEEVSGVSVTHYEPIPGLFNSGVDANGDVIAPGGNPTSTDPHWTITSSANSFTGPAVIQANHPAWLSNDAAGGPGSSWISVVNAGQTGIPGGDYTFETTFDLMGLDPETAEIHLDIAADNSYEVFLNNDATVLASGGGFTSFDSFVLDDGFISGLNSLQIVLNNASAGPGGLRVEIAGIAQEPVPEPTSIAIWSLLGLALAAFGYYRARRKS